MWLYGPPGTRGKSPKLQPLWKGVLRTTMTLKLRCMKRLKNLNVVTNTALLSKDKTRAKSVRVSLFNNALSRSD